MPPECINTRVVVPDQRTALAEPRDRYIELGRGEGWNMDFKDALTAGCLGCHRCVANQFSPQLPTRAYRPLDTPRRTLLAAGAERLRPSQIGGRGLFPTRL